MDKNLYRLDPYDDYIRNMQRTFYNPNLILGFGPKECRDCPDSDMYGSDCKRISKMVIPGYEDGKEGIPRNFFLRCPFKV